MDSSDKEFKTESIKQDYQNATIKDDFDAILRKYDIKMLKNNKRVSPLRVKLDIKKRIIRMSFQDPDDVFDYDAFVNI